MALQMDFPRHVPIDSEWYKKAFNELYPILYAHRSLEAAAEEVRFALSVVGLGENDLVLDFCCGGGRHSVGLVRSGKRVVGLDFSRALLHEARKRLKGSALLVRADMRSVPFEGSFDAVFSFFTSFGYFLQAEDNRQALQEMSRSLKPGGRFFIDHINEAYIKQNLVPTTKRDVGSITVLETRWIEDNRVNKKTEIYEGSSLRDTIVESVQLYSREEFCAMLEEVGLQVKKLYGDYNGSPIRPDLPRMIVTGEKF